MALGPAPGQQRKESGAPGDLQGDEKAQCQNGPSGSVGLVPYGHVRGYTKGAREPASEQVNADHRQGQVCAERADQRGFTWA
jgi:hypothetical protein